MKVIAFVFARGGSKGIIKKNLQILDGKPLIAHSIECAHSIDRIDRVIVSTEDQEIAEVARSYGAEVPFMRPMHLALDSSAEYLAWKHAIQEVFARSGKFDIMLSLPATSPLRSVEDVTKCLNESINFPEADAVITVQKASRSPYFNMVKKDADGFCSLVIQSDGYVRRQDVPEVFDVTTVAYAVRTDFVMRSTSLFEGKVRCIEVPATRAIDIDEPLDLEFAKFLTHK
ncbi:MAG: acylneuraminate cytidylyltransferase family protein [bacterium]